MPWEGGQIFVADVIVSDDQESLSTSNAKHIAGEKGKVATGYPSWANNNTLLFTSDESGYSNPWKFDVARGKASPIFAQPIAQDFAEPMWSLSMFPYVVTDIAGTQALWTAIKDGRDTFYLVDIEGKIEPRVVETPYVAVHGLKVISRERHEIVFCGQKIDASEDIVGGSISSLAFSSIKPPAAANNVELSPSLVSEPRAITLTVQPGDSPLHVVYYGPHNPNYAGSSIEGERPPCVVHLHGGPTANEAQGLNWKKQYFTTRGWAWCESLSTPTSPY